MTLQEKINAIISFMLDQRAFALEGTPLLMGWYNHMDPHEVEEHFNEDGILKADSEEEAALHVQFESEGAYYDEFITLKQLAVWAETCTPLDGLIIYESVPKESFATPWEGAAQAKVVERQRN